MKVKFLLIIMCSLLCSISANEVFAQGSTTSAMNGKVTDSNGEAVPGATVLAVHVPTGSQFGNITGADGYYRIPNLAVGGPYTVTVSFVGFEDVVKSNIYLTLGQTFRFNATMSESVTTLEEVLVVSQSTEIFDGNRTGASTTVGEQQLQTLPNASRSINDFTRLTPQASFAPASNGISIAGMNNRYNSIFIDGAVSNDVFGLAGNGQNGGQISGLSLISIDALEQVQVNVAPYDVTLGGFSGGSISAVTRSGNNEFEGSVYYLLRNQSLAGKTPTLVSEDNREKLADFTAQTYGFRLGGPIIKDKLFFFVNAEIQDEETPRPFDFDSYTGAATLTDVQDLVSKLQGFGYEPGSFEDVKDKLEAQKFLVKLDYNLNQNHKLSLRHSYNKGDNLSPGRSNSSRIRFENSGIAFLSETNATTFELKSNFGGSSNNLILGYTSVNDNRDPMGQRFPYVDISSGDVEVGSEQFSTANVLEQKIFTLTDNFTLYKGKHTLTFGTHNEYYDINNVFIRQNFGAYRYNNIGEFVTDVAPNQYDRSYSLVDDVTGDGTAAAAAFKALQLAFYAQDEIQVNDNLKLTVGLRIDIPMFLDDPVDDGYFNDTAVPAIEGFGYDLQGAQAGKAPGAQIMLNPRIGFNYDLKGDQTTQIRGGIGVFTSRVPFVWPGGMYNNNGATVGGTRQFSGLVFEPDPDNQPTVGDFGGSDDIPQGQMDLFTEDFKYPQFMRTSIAVDQKLPWGLIGTVEFIYTKTLNNVFYENVNLKPSVENLEGTPDNRPYFDRGDEIDDNYTRILLGSNTSQGYSANFSVSLQKPFNNGLTGSVAYNFGRSEAVFEGTSSQNSSQWRGVYSLIGRNDATVGRSDFDAGHRVVAAVSKRFEYANHLATTLTFFYNGQSGKPFSYTYDSDIGNEDSRERSLIFVPADASQIVFDETSRSAAEQWADLDAYINGDDYLKDRRGQYAEKNMGRTPWEGVIDMKIQQEFFIETGNGKRHNLEVSFDIFNFTNFLNKDWGRRYGIPNGGSTSVQLLNFEGFQAGTLTPTYSFNDGISSSEDVLTQDDSGIISSRWQAQLGIRYTF